MRSAFPKPPNRDIVNIPFDSLALHDHGISVSMISDPQTDTSPLGQKFAVRGEGWGWSLLSLGEGAGHGLLSSVQNVGLCTFGGEASVTIVLTRLDVRIPKVPLSVFSVIRFLYSPGPARLWAWASWGSGGGSGPKALVPPMAAIFSLLLLPGGQGDQVKKPAARDHGQARWGGRGGLRSTGLCSKNGPKIFSL